MEKKRIIVIGAILVATVLIGILGTYAFFITTAGRQENQVLTVNVGTMALTFSDNSNKIEEALMLGESVTKEFKIENTGTEEVTTNMMWKDLYNTYLEESLSYTFEYKMSEGGTWQPVETAHPTVPHSEYETNYNLAKNLTIPSKTTYYYRLTIKLENLTDVNQEADKKARLSTVFMIGDTVTEPTEAEKVLMHLNITPKSGNPNFASKATTDEGVYSMADDYGTSYYYRGAVTNNYVKFGNFYWRIIRVNGDGSLRMIYDGTVAHKNGNGAETFEITGTDGAKISADRFIATGIAWNTTNNNDAKYVGWMYGGANGTASTSRDGATSTAATYNETNSNAKTVVDDWYKTNIYDANLDKYIADSIFCNDRSITNDYDATYTLAAGYGKGYGANVTSYAARNRFYFDAPGYVNATPKFTCTQKNDAFTVSDTTKGNGALTYKVGLITADEMVTAGSGKYNTTNRYYYLYKSSNLWYWALSISAMSAGGAARTCRTRIDGALSDTNVNNSEDGALAPVINISANYAKTMIGSGTIISPYQIPGVD